MSRNFRGPWPSGCNASRTRGGLLLPASLGIVLTLIATSAPADIIHLTSGKTIEGQVIRSTDDKVTIETTSGIEFNLSRTQIARIESTPAPTDELARQEAELPTGDAAAVYELATWAGEKKLRDDAKRLLWRTLELDPDHKGAREALGFRKLGALWLTEDDYQRMHGKVQFKGKWVTKDEWRALQRREHTIETLMNAEDSFRVAAGKGKLDERQAALEELRNLRPDVRTWALLKGAESLRWRERQFAVRELGVLGNRKYGKVIAHMAITDRKRSVRDEALQTLKTWNDPDTVLSFIPHLNSQNDGHRVNASRAISQFPDRRAAGPLITTLEMVWAGFGRVHFSQVTQRAYVKDYELVSGGTGLVVQEVADPVVDTFVDGVVLDIQIRRVEAVARVSALQKITGQKFGMNFKKWEQWWASETSKASSLAKDS